jgi:DnaJ-class molecular chaperone
MSAVMPTVQCPKCGGTGSRKGWLFRRPCRECNGEGVLLQCPDCAGEGYRKGWFSMRKCKRCGGRGLVYRTQPTRLLPPPWFNNPFDPRNPQWINNPMNPMSPFHRR